VAWPTTLIIVVFACGARLESGLADGSIALVDGFAEAVRAELREMMANSRRILGWNQC